MVFVVENVRARYLEGVDIIRLVAWGGAGPGRRPGAADRWWKDGIRRENGMRMVFAWRIGRKEKRKIFASYSDGI